VVGVGERAMGAVAAPGARGEEGRGPVQVSLRRNVWVHSLCQLSFLQEEASQAETNRLLTCRMLVGRFPLY
jgi:hypothetical protein